MSDHAFSLLSSLLAEVDVNINGDRPWDIQVHDKEHFATMLSRGTLGIGEGYVRGWWDCNALDELAYRVLHTNFHERVREAAGFRLGLLLGWERLKRFIRNPQSIARAKLNVSAHYDTGNNLFKAMLDRRMAYSCGYWKDTNDLNIAQEQKLDLLCRKMGLKPGMHVLDVGCGWGSFMLYAAEKYGVICEGVTLSKQQFELGSNLARESGLPVTFLLKDYRILKPEKPYDAIVSVGMLEHVGEHNYQEYFRDVRSLLKKDGVFVLHTIGQVRSCSGLDPWMNKYIFPNGHIPSLQQLEDAMEGHFLIDDMQNIGEDYAKTLVVWEKNFEAAWETLRQHYSETFHRMWRYYLLTCAGGFKARFLQVWQFGLTPPGMPKKQCLRAS